MFVTLVRDEVIKTMFTNHDSEREAGAETAGN